MHTLDHMDVSRRINLADPLQVRDEVCMLLCTADQGVDRRLIGRAFDVFTRLYDGTLPGYHRCETRYHDMQHALDVTLAAARLMAGHECRRPADERLGAERLTLGIIVALYHDAGYIRRRSDHTCWHGAQYTRVHVARGARFLAGFLKTEDRASWTARAVRLIHFTGYEIPLDKIRLKDPLDRRLGSLIGTADLIAQMADPHYLEKCRDFLFEEFELGGLTRSIQPDGSERVLYGSADELLRKTPAFYAGMVKKRLDDDFDHVYDCVEPIFNGQNPYLDGIHRNIGYLQKLLDDERLAEALRRHIEPVPPQ